MYFKIVIVRIRKRLIEKKVIKFRFCELLKYLVVFIIKVMCI